jgi:ATP/maltotriose-dependent transcriptional regulator MalT
MVEPDPVPTHGPLPSQAPLLPEPLTERELAVLRLIAAGRSNREIAGELFIAVSTVKWYTGNLFGKLGTRSRTAAIVRARELGLLA